MKEKKEITYGVRFFGGDDLTRKADGFVTKEIAIDIRDTYRKTGKWKQVEAVMVETTVKETVL